jgi:hypothetical protein
MWSLQHRFAVKRYKREQQGFCAVEFAGPKDDYIITGDNSTPPSP